MDVEGLSGGASFCVFGSHTQAAVYLLSIVIFHIPFISNPQIPTHFQELLKMLLQSCAAQSGAVVLKAITVD